ncbi:hypothetical protein J4416_03115 [Candidatus Pacearchaeota archaeon]|nr:hypothetical protein [Candidatus Pacearchaeota archaeon]
MKKRKKKEKKEQEIKKDKIRRTHPRIVITSLAALAFIGLALFVWPWFILVAVFLWWLNKKYIKKFLS